MEDDKLGSNIQDLRIRKNMTQEMVAEYMKVSRQTISKWEANKSKPSTKNLIMLADFFQVPLSELTSINSGNGLRTTTFNKTFLVILIIIYCSTCILFSMGKGDSLLQSICLFIIMVMSILISINIWKMNILIRKKIAVEQLVFCIMCWLLNVILIQYLGNILTMILTLTISVIWIRKLYKVF